MARKLTPREAGCRVAFGTCGSGKSYGIEQDIREGSKLYPWIVLDGNGEWATRKSGPPGTVNVRSIADAVRAFDDGKRIAIVQPNGNHAELVEEACAWAVSRGESMRGNVTEGAVSGIAVPEAHRVWPVNGPRLSPNVDKCITQWRHVRCTMGVDTQRMPRLDPTITDLARETRIYAIGGERAIKRLREIGGDELVEAVAVCMERFQEGGGVGGTGAGWHVTVDESWSPPYEITR